MSIDNSIVYQDMTLKILDPEANDLAQTLAQKTGETLTETIVIALRERLTRIERESKIDERRDKIKTLQNDIANLPVLDGRLMNDILGYNAYGLPTD